MIQQPLQVLQQHPAAAHHIVECKEFAPTIETTHNVEQMIDHFKMIQMDMVVIFKMLLF